MNIGHEMTMKNQCWMVDGDEGLMLAFSFSLIRSSQPSILGNASECIDDHDEWLTVMMYDGRIVQVKVSGSH